MCHAPVTAGARARNWWRPLSALPWQPHTAPSAMLSAFHTGAFQEQMRHSSMPLTLRRPGRFLEFGSVRKRSPNTCCTPWCLWTVRKSGLACSPCPRETGMDPPFALGRPCLQMRWPSQGYMLEGSNVDTCLCNVGGGTGPPALAACSTPFLACSRSGTMTPPIRAAIDRDYKSRAASERHRRILEQVVIAQLLG